jgi:hypothetical protein
VAGVELPGAGGGGKTAANNKEMLAAAKQEVGGDDVLAALEVLAARFERGVVGMAKMAGQRAEGEFGGGGVGEGFR